MSLLYWAGFVFLGVTPLVAISVMLYCKYKKHHGHDDYVFAFHIVAPLIISLFVYNIFLTSFASVSRIDVSPIARLTAEQVASADNIMDWFEEQDFVYRHRWRFVVRPEHGILSDESQLFYIDGGYFSLRHYGVAMPVFVDLYCEQVVSRGFLNGSRTLRERGYTHIINENNTEILLQHPRGLPRYLGGSSHVYWQLITHMRIGNVVIWFPEIRGRHSLNNDLSSMFIERMVEMIKTEAEYD